MGRDILLSMSSGLSPQIEQKIAEALAGGLYPTREALIEAGVERLLDEEVAMVPEEDMALVEAAIESSLAERSQRMKPEDWDELHRVVANVAAGKHRPGE